MTYGTVQANAIQGSINTFSPNSAVFRNRIINGDCRIDQRNAGASVTVNADIYTLDRWKVFQSATGRFSVQQNAGSVTPPAGFTNYLGITSLAATTPTSGQYFLVDQWIEGFNVADLSWGGSNAKAVTLSFWVRSSVTGTHTGAIGNANYSRSYAFTYTVSSANTWELKTITIPGDTTGSWNTTNGTGLALRFALSIGSGRTASNPNVWNATGTDGASGAVNVLSANGNTWYITGVQLEVGSTATSFDYRPYGTELALCQRYYFRHNASATISAFCLGHAVSSTGAYGCYQLPTVMRSVPSFNASSNFYFNSANGSPQVITSSLTFGNASFQTGLISGAVASGLTAGNVTSLLSSASTSYLEFSSEL